MMEIGLIEAELWIFKYYFN